jgi:hypothetical protein
LIPDYIPESEQIKPSGDSNFIRILGWTATISSISMYFAYIDQISRNLDGQKAPHPAAGSLISTTLWACYAYFREQRDWPLLGANLPGVILAGIAAVTAL